MKICFIINPAAGTGKIKGDREAILNFFRDSDHVIEVLLTSGTGSAFSLASHAVESGYEVVVAVGGDGTINETVRAVAQTNTALGIIPRGSGNGLARHHRIPFAIEKALQTIVNNKRVKHDAVLINGHMAVNVSGIGFDAHIACLFGKDGTRGFYGYLKLVVSEFFRFKEHLYRIENISGKTTEGLRKEVDVIPQTYPVFLFAIANCSQFGNEAVFAPEADHTDGLVDLTLVRRMPAWKVPLFALKVFTHHVEGSKYATFMKGREFRITAEEEVPLHLDGEPGGYAKEYTVSALKGVFSLIIP